MFITFEGIDGVGKSTQLKLLSEYFTSLGKEVLALREPGGTKFSELIRDILLDNSNNLNSVSELMLFEAARADLVEQIIKPALKNGIYVLCDRFYDSTTAYQGYGRQLPLEEVINCNLFATRGLQPDLTILLELPLKEAQERSGRKKIDRMELSGDNFYNRVIEGFTEIAKKESGRIIRIDASNDIEATYKLILENVKRIIEIKEKII